MSSAAHSSFASTLLAPPTVPSLRSSETVLHQLGRYRVRLAASDQERDAAFELRFRVFNLELNEGLDSAMQTGRDVDQFDAACDHLIVQDVRSGDVVGTYRMQLGTVAARRYGYYSAQEFDFSPFEALRGEMLEVGRACIHPAHRTFDVLMLLWRGIATYARKYGARYVIGCSSVTSQDPQVGWALYRKLQPYLTEPHLRTLPTPAYALPEVAGGDGDAKPPKLLRGYLSVGAQICGSPALDRDFKTIDFLTMLDLENLSPALKVRFFGREEACEAVV